MIYYSKYFIELILTSLHNMLPFEFTKDTPYLALSGELWSVFYEYFTEIDRVIKGFYCMMCELFKLKMLYVWYIRPSLCGKSVNI